MTWKEWIIKASAFIKNSDNPKHEAEILLMKVIGISRTYLLAFNDTLLEHKHYKKLEILLHRRKCGEPIAYLIGEWDFWSLCIKVSSDTFIPRPDTECIVEIILTLFPEYTINAEILDLGTGTGAIALALASERTEWNITGVDINIGAILIARENSIILNIRNTQFIYSNWFKILKGIRYNIILSNPPYIDINDQHLNKCDIRFEPNSALVADANGLADIKNICFYACSHLFPGGWLVLEHGFQQGKTVRKILNKNGFINITTVCDYCGNERVSLGQFYIF